MATYHPDGSEMGESPAAPATYEEYCRINTNKGEIKIHAFAGPQALPVSGVQITITKALPDGEHVLFRGATDIDGIIDSIVVPTPPRQLSMFPNLRIPYATYRIYAHHPEFRLIPSFGDIAVFDGIKSIRRIPMVRLQRAE
nr:hypothetical protein [bacterium]